MIIRECSACGDKQMDVVVKCTSCKTPVAFGDQSDFTYDGDKISHVKIEGHQIDIREISCKCDNQNLEI